MGKVSNPTAGLHDPYWYESSVGLVYIIDMLNPDIGIETVTLQAEGLKGLDDIVVKYRGGNQKLVQVKHTRADDSITFGDLLTIDEDAKVRDDDKIEKMSLLTQLANAWNEASQHSSDCTALLYTNRKAGQRPYTRSTQHKRPSLATFWPDLKSKLQKSSKLEEISFDTEYEAAWTELLSHLDILVDADKKFQFLSRFDIDYSQPTLEELGQKLLKKISDAFGINTNQAQTVLADLDTSLRRWATTSRGKKQTVTIEDVYDALSLSRNESVGDHYLAPPEPFFRSRTQLVTDLEDVLKKRSHRIVFLSGKPGYGKTSIISALTNRHDPVIDLRFHSYRPITPNSPILPSDAGRTAKPEALWGDLLIQLRSLLRGRLAKYRIPVRNDFLSADELRNHVLRISSQLATDQARTIVIAIDGIDHAARASLKQDLTFLATLVTPDNVPSGVCFLIAGQPGYEAYPSWLKQAHSDVRAFEVPPVETGDIAPLVAVHGKLLPTEQHAAAERIICGVAGGSTLAAVFAAHELDTCADITELQQRLEKRNLKDGVSSYYENIWSSAIDEVENRVPFVGYSVAGCISLTSERLTGDMLKSIFKDLNLTTPTWNEVLRKLRPLLIEEPGGFRILHNDVRVFLQQKMQVEPERLSYIAGQMADYYLNSPAAVTHRHYSLFGLLDLSKRQQDKAKVFNTAFVLEAHLSGQAIGELAEQAREAFGAAIGMRSWEYLHQVQCALATLRQLDRSVSWIGRPGSTSVERNEQLPPVLMAEGRVPLREAWNVATLRAAIDDALRLIAADESDRARGLLKRWFGAATPHDVAALLKEDEVYIPKEREVGLGRILTESFQTFLGAWGTACHQTAWLRGMTLGKGASPRERSLNASFIGGALESAAQSPNRMPWMRTHRRSLSTDTSAGQVERLLTELAEQRRWKEVAYSLRRCRSQPEKFSTTFRVRAGAWAILLNLPDLHTALVAPLLKDGFQLLRDARGEAESLLSTTMYLSFVLGTYLPGRTPSGIREDAVNEYYGIMQGEMDRPYVAALCYSSALAGKWFKACLDKAKLRAQNIATLHEIRRVFQTLLAPDLEQVRMLTQSIDKVTIDLLETLIYCIEYAGDAPRDEAREIIKASAAKHSITTTAPVVWNYLASCGYYELLNKWLDAWINKDTGKIWSDDIAGRFAAIEALSPLAELCNRSEDLAATHQRLLWGAVGYTGHKEYSLSTPLHWFKALSVVAPASWREEGLRLLALSAEASRARDNRLDDSIESAVVTAACQCSVADLWLLLLAQDGQGKRIWSTKGNRSLLDGIANFITSSHLSEEELLVLWSLAIGCLWWSEYYDREHIIEFRKAMLICAVREGHAKILEHMAIKSPLGTSLTSDEKATAEPTVKPSDFVYNIKLSIEDAIQAMRTWIENNPGAAHGSIWLAVAEVARRLETEHPSNFDEHLKELIALLTLREESYRSYHWSWDGIVVAYEAIIPLLSESARWECAEKILQNGDHNNLTIWLEYMEDCLDTLCLCRAKAQGASALRAGLQQTLHTHETWVTGNGKLSAIKAVVIAERSVAMSPPAWSTLVFRVLSPMLDSDCGDGIEAALRGLWCLLETDRSVMNLLASHLPEAGLRAKPYLLLLVERLIIANYDTFAVLESAIKHCLEIRDIQITLQCWVVLDAYHRQSRQVVPSVLRAASQPKNHVLIVNSPKIPEIPSEKLGSLRLNIGVSGYLERLRIIVNEELNDIETKFTDRWSAAEGTSSTPDDEPKERRSGMMISRRTDLKLLSEIIWDEISGGRWSDIPLAQFAQVLLPNEDPFIALRSPTPSQEPSLWLIDSDIQTKEKLLIFFNQLATSDLLEDSVVIGALISAYTDKLDLQYSYNHIASRQQPPKDRLGGSTTPSGRSFAFYRNDIYVPAQPFGMWLTWIAGGIATLIAQDFGIVPSSVWRTLFAWNPCPNDPTVWLKNGEKVAWYERIAGPLRSAVGERYSRQPVMRRWVCTKNAWKQINDVLADSPPQARECLDSFSVSRPD
ncbi:MAG: ATP-binding protein [Oligoflexia bacterium]|nr:ATP-binding protein [Oligoflexia bacterium]